MAEQLNRINRRAGQDEAVWKASAADGRNAGSIGGVPTDGSIPRDSTRIRYAWNGDVALAYQIVGDGPVDIVYLQGWTSNIDLAWQSPYLSSFLRGLASLGRLIATDRRGWGCSDRFSPSDVPPFEVLVDDLVVVMDAAEAERPVLLATAECSATAALLAGMYPGRLAALVLCDPLVTFASTEETTGLMSRRSWQDWFAQVRAEYPKRTWWRGPDDHPEREWFERYVRSSATPGGLIAEFRRFLETDVRSILSTVRVPTLVIVDPEGEDDTDPRNGCLVADRIPGARLVEVAGGDGLSWNHWYGRADGIVREAGRFIRELSEEEARFDRVLATVLFTDIVGSTARAAELGDRTWRDLLSRHNAIVRGMLARYHGTEISTAGDGFFASFEGPARAIRCAHAISEAVQSLGLEIRAGVHTGEVEAIDGEIGGMAVVIGARIGAKAAASEVWVSQTVKDLVAGSSLSFEERGEHDLKGVPDRWRLYRVVR
jgi:class 3 adenylate cyclase/pimeloyl-ACP methyl ester carboxylesterase